MIISPSEISFVRQSCADNFRMDGRSNLHHRPYSLLSPTSSPILSNGSSRLFLPASNTDILCSIKAELVHPPFIKSEGVIDLNVDILPFASLSKDRKDIRKEEQEVTSTLTHLLLPHLLNRNKLVVLKGRYVWRLNIDILVTHCDGTLMDACSMAIFGAMQNLRLPSIIPVEKVDHGDGANNGQAGGKKSRASDEIMLDGDIANSVCPDEGGVLDCPVVLTVCLIPVNANDIASVRRVKKKNESVMIIDACRQEERCASTKISISVDGKGNVCGVHKYGSSSVLGNSLGNIKFEMLPQIQNVAISCSQSVFAMLKKSHDDNGAGKGLGNAEDVYSNFFRSQFELQ